MGTRHIADGAAFGVADEEWEMNRQAAEAAKIRER
jgi:hypothetical protein